MTSEAIRRTMRSNRRKDTEPELKARAILREIGFPGYRLQWGKVPGHPDIAYPGRKIAIFVNGCFWHHHENCPLAYTPKSNVDFWKNKFASNMRRNQKTTEALIAAGWTVIIIWECELRESTIESTRTRLESILESNTSDTQVQE